MPSGLSTLEQHAREALAPDAGGRLAPGERLARCRRFLKTEEHRLKLHHRAGGPGLEIACGRARLHDLLLASVLETTAAERGLAAPPIALVATGGYGAGTLNPASEVELLFLLPVPGNRLPPDLRELVQAVLYLLWDLGLKLNHASRSTHEASAAARASHHARTAIADARFVAGDRPLFDSFAARCAVALPHKAAAAFLKHCRDDLTSRHHRHSDTVFLQEPNVHEGCGGLLDAHTLRWICRASFGTPDLKALAEQKLLGRPALHETRLAEDFLHRVRNELHYHTGGPTDILTLQLQGVVATRFGYPQRPILRRTEALMRDYYRHTRNLCQHTLSVIEALDLQRHQQPRGPLRSLLGLRRRPPAAFDGFLSRDGLLHPADPGIFRDDPQRLLRLFHHCQLRGLRPSPPLRRLIKEHWHLIDRTFRRAKPNRETFRAILERKGEVARTLRQMHRVGVLGRFLPEFGALDCLVQHEFFHRYTADEHTLRCIEALDALADAAADPRRTPYRRLLHEAEDPYALYLALILHDTGRAENAREHVDASSALAARVCNRLQVRGPRRALLTFLVDHHLSFWRFATTRNIEDPEVVAAFADIVRTPQRLDLLLLFTFADSNGTAPDAWTGWKESLLLQLHASTRRFLEQGGEAFAAALAADREQLRREVAQTLKPAWDERVRDHFAAMPARYFRFRDAAHVAAHVRAVQQLVAREHSAPGGFHDAVQWIDHPGKLHTELAVVTRDRPLLLEHICCALASEEVNILSADFFTRGDGIVVDLFRVHTAAFAPVDDPGVRQRVVDTFHHLQQAGACDAASLLRRRPGLPGPRPGAATVFPARARLSNTSHPACTVVEVQALDRIGLLHDVFRTVNAHGLSTAHARICTEKGAAMDTLYLTTADGRKVTDPRLCDQLCRELEQLAAAPEPE